ncbi:hypothetical protein DAPPUDRAFT_238399 [Daphnia pulex]|uniref:Uncharacterized protein n=1 Tax=Daphnia pulex TaxID=6669 RepID=E9G6A5_DAPPU|nr:hypothetical protein DAPPUDRAFT_238399 [Daphnia pulex]|eukprot:EFX84899.1 hypothetical protein DAPPUDRAFT_238399 [Daphnia pulex]
MNNDQDDAETETRSMIARIVRNGEDTTQRGVYNMLTTTREQFFGFLSFGAIHKDTARWELQSVF